jgi:hypothetical protein
VSICGSDGGAIPYPCKDSAPEVKAGRR